MIYVLLFGLRRFFLGVFGKFFLIFIDHFFIPGHLIYLLVVEIGML